MNFNSPGKPFRPQTAASRAGRYLVTAVLVTLLAVLVGACGGPSGSSGGGAQQGTVSTLSPRIFILGTQVDMLGNLRIFVHGLDQNGTPLTLADYQTATVTVAAVPYAVSVPGPGDVTVKLIDPNEPLMSLAMVTDYSDSILDADLDRIAVVNNSILTSLPAIFEGAVFNFSDTVIIRQDWTENLAALQAAVQRDNMIIRNNTALYDAMGSALERGLPMDPDGLIERCRPIRMLVVHTDGEDNFSGMYDKPTLLTLIDDSRTIPIMLGTQFANATELFEFAGERGAFVFDVDLDGIEAEVANWVGSFGANNLVEFNLTPATGFDPGPVQIDLGTLSVMVEPPYDQSCTMP